MKNLSKNLQPLVQTDLDIMRFSSILQDEEYIDENKKPLMCYICDSENFMKYYKVELNNVDDKYKQQILEIYPNLSNCIVTFWVCEDCDNVIALKLYSHNSYNEKKMYYSKYDSFNHIIKFLKEKGYIESNREPCQCWYCKSDNIQITKTKENEIATCNNCYKTLGYYYDENWRIIVENE